ncbi:MAG TPA: quinolinate synthase NadA, partial [Pseudomonadales bacterium]|nr:quinolinate synthase NadA [Pseudomonadales bacterium]
EAPTGGRGATCHSCAHCPWMAMNHLENLLVSLRDECNEIELDAELCRQAMVPLERMLAFSKSLPPR